MARKRQKFMIQRTVHLSPDVDTWIEQEAKKEMRSFSNMADVILRRVKLKNSEECGGHSHAD